MASTSSHLVWGNSILRWKLEQRDQQIWQALKWVCQHEFNFLSFPRADSFSPQTTTELLLKKLNHQFLIPPLFIVKTVLLFFDVWRLKFTHVYPGQLSNGGQGGKGLNLFRIQFQSIFCQSGIEIQVEWKEYRKLCLFQILFLLFSLISENIFILGFHTSSAMLKHNERFKLWNEAKEDDSF